MKKTVFVVLFCLVSTGIFCLDNDLPGFLFEINAGYAFGVNMDNAVHFEGKITYSFSRFGFVLEVGSMVFSDSMALHLLVGPLLYIVNNNRLRFSLTLGFDSLSENTHYLGLGGIISLHYRITEHIYVGINLELTYAFNHIYAELTGYRTTETKFNDGTVKTQTVPVIENQNHYGNYFYFKPKLLVGVQI